jgi:hypothetical protein
MDVIMDFFASTYHQIITDCQDDPEAMAVMRRALRPAFIIVGTLVAGFCITGIDMLLV